MMATSCLSCGIKIKGPSVVVTKIKEYDCAARAYIVHEACQSGMLLDVPFDETRLGSLEGTPGLG